MNQFCFALSSVILNTLISSQPHIKHRTSYCIWWIKSTKKGLSFSTNLTETICNIFHFGTETIQHIVSFFIFYSLSMKIFEKFFVAENTKQAINWMNITKRMNVISICCQQFKHRKEKPIEIFIRPLFFTHNFSVSPPVAASLSENRFIFIFIFYVSIVVDGDHCELWIVSIWDKCEKQNCIVYEMPKPHHKLDLLSGRWYAFRKRSLERTWVENGEIKGIITNRASINTHFKLKRCTRLEY